MTWLYVAVAILLALTASHSLAFWLGNRARKWDWNQALRFGREECESHHERSKA